MKYKIYSIYDSVAEEFGPLFQAKTDGVAFRIVEDLIKKNPVNLDDYYLHCIGSFDSEDGTILSESNMFHFSDLFSDPVELEEVSN